MVEVVSPTRSEFLATATESFGFLDEFGSAGLCEDTKNPYHVFFNTAYCVVDVVGRSFGFALDVGIRTRDHDAEVNPFDGVFPLWAILKLRDPELYDRRFHHTSGQLKMIRMDAEAVRTHAQDLLSGDFKLLPQMATFLEQEYEESRTRWQKETEDYEFRQAGHRADEAFRAKDFRTVAEELGKHKSRLSRSQVAKLRYARKHMPKSWFQKLRDWHERT